MATVTKNVIHPFTLATASGPIHFGIGAHEVEADVAAAHGDYIDAFCVKPPASDVEQTDAAQTDDSAAKRGRKAADKE